MSKITLDEASAIFADLCIKPQQDDVVLIIYDASRTNIATQVATAIDKRAQRCVSIPVLALPHSAAAAYELLAQSALACQLTQCSCLITFLGDGDNVAAFRAFCVGTARNAGGRIVHLPGVDEQMFRKAIESTDFDSIIATCKKIESQLQQTKFVNLATASVGGKSLNLSISVDGENLLRCGGSPRPGEIVNFPTGESYFPINSTDVNGRIALEGSTYHRLYDLSDQVELEFVDGILDIDKSSFGATRSSTELEKYLQALSDDNLRICEIGFGTNPAMKKLTGSEVRDEKALGTVHIAIGTNVAFGGSVLGTIHRDIVIKNARILLSNGNMLQY